LKSTINTSLQKLPQNRFKNAEDMIKSIDLSIEILSATQSNKNLFFPKDKAASPVEILSHKVATQPIDKLVFNGKYVYIAVGTHIFYIPYNKTFLPKLKDTQKIKLQDQILDIKVMPFGCMAIVKRQNHYTLYAINNNKIFNKIEQNFTNLIISNGDNQNWFATAENSCLNTWKIPEFTNVKNLVNRKIFRQLMIIDNLHGIAVLDANTNSQSPLFLFNRRGNLVKAFTLQTAFSMVAVNKNYRIFAIEDTEEKLEVIGLLIDLKPLKIKRIALEIKPDFILCQAWGYILANHRGDILILNQKGDCLKKYQLSVGKITAITALPTNRILIASWQNDRASLSYARIRLQ
jgi:serine/threonine-protein kinase